MYTSTNYKEDITKLIIDKGYDPVIVAKFTYQLFSAHQSDIDDDLYNKMIDIFTMEDGPEFEMTENEFMDFIEQM